MTGQEGSLAARYRRRIDVPALLLLSAALLLAGLFSPVVTMRRLGGSSESTYSVVTGILDLARNSHLYLAAIIFTSSLIFPVVKLGALTTVWFFDLPGHVRVEWLHRLRFLGKWSMLDVFVVALLVGLLNLGWVSDARPRAGIYAFGTSILLSMVAIHLVERLAGMAFEPVPRRGLPVLTALPLEVPALLCLGAGYELPLMSVDKWVFWHKDYSILSGTAELVHAGRWGVAGCMVLFVIVAPTARLLCYLGLRMVRREGEEHARLIRLARLLNRWTMVEVFTLGLFVVGIKLANQLALTPEPGLWFFLAGVMLSVFLSWPVRRA